MDCRILLESNQAFYKDMPEKAKFVFKKSLLGMGRAMQMVHSEMQLFEEKNNLCGLRRKNTTKLKTPAQLSSQSSFRCATISSS